MAVTPVAEVLRDAQIAVLAAGLLIKACHLARRPHDRTLRAVVACFVLFGLSALAGRGTSPAAPEYALLLWGCFAIATALADRGGGGGPRRRGHAGLLVAAVAVTVACGAAAHPWTAVMHVVAGTCVAGILVRAARDGRRLVRSADTGRTQAAGMAVATAGLYVLAAGALLLVATNAAVLLAVPPPAWPGLVGSYALLVGPPVIVAGICHPGLVMRRRALALWLRRCREYRRLGPLWRLLAETFPQQRLRRAPGAAMLRISRAHCRRRVECRDGLVRLSPHVPDAVAGPTVSGPGRPAAVRPLAGWMLDHCGNGADELPGRTTAKPLLVPRGERPEEDLALLFALADAIVDRRRAPTAGRGRPVSLPAGP